MRVTEYMTGKVDKKTAKSANFICFASGSCGWFLSKKVIPRVGLSEQHPPRSQAEADEAVSVVRATATLEG